MANCDANSKYGCFAHGDINNRSMCSNTRPRYFVYLRVHSFVAIPEAWHTAKKKNFCRCRILSQDRCRLLGTEWRHATEFPTSCRGCANTACDWLRAFVASFLSAMLVGGSETRASEVVKEGPGWGERGGGAVARQHTDRSRMPFGFCVWREG